jgi:thymidylate synthase
MKNIPILIVSEQSLARAYEAALIGLYKNGVALKTQYDKADDPLSLDCTMNATILEPESDPMIHLAFPGGVESLKEYVMELKGFKDHWVKNINDPNDTRWEYTYHGRLKNYGAWKEKDDAGSVEKGFFKIDQIESVINKLVKQPFTRQAQMITWMPNLDLQCYDPPCLQSLWYRILEDDDGIYWLNCNIRFRSNDAWNASFMNMFGFIQFNKEIIAAEVAKRTGKTVKLGRLNWQADSYHIYGKDIKSARELLFDRVETMSFEKRTYNFNDEFIRQMYDEAEQPVLDKIKEFDLSHK